MLREYQPCNIVAEACCNHLGNIQIAEEMIVTAKICGADYIKFQKRCPEISVPKNLQNKPHPNPSNAFGKTYNEHRKALEFNIEQHKYLKSICEKTGIKYACSVWDVVSANEIISVNPDYIKLPSAMNNNFELIEHVYRKYNGNIHVSLGMATKKEQKELLNYIGPFFNRTVLYWTTSGYPVKFEELFLLEIQKLDKFKCQIGYSGHHLGIAVDVVAYTLGATWIERHFTLDRTWKGTDQAASLEPSGLQKLCRDLKACQKSLKFKKSITQDEKENRKKLRIK